MSDLENRHFKLLWGIRRSIRYHVHRQSFFEGFNTCSNVVALLFGSGAILTVLAKYPDWLTISLAAFVTVFSTINLVVRTTERAQAHRDFSKQFHEIEKNLMAGRPTEEMIQKAMARRLEIEADEPPVLLVLDAICHNEMLRSEGYDRITDASQHCNVTRTQRLFAHIFDLWPDKIDRGRTSSPKPC